MEKARIFLEKKFKYYKLSIIFMISIKNGSYIDEGILIDIDDKSEKKSVVGGVGGGGGISSSRI